HGDGGVGGRPEVAGLLQVLGQRRVPDASGRLPGVTQMTAGLDYAKQPGALNESFSDVFGSLVKQHHLRQTATEADWLIGARVLGSALKGKALRSLKDPGSANDLDRQAGSM